MTAAPSEGELVTDPTCPACGTEFTSVRGMRVHHTKVHGVPLPNRACRDCGVPFYDPDGQRILCADCQVPRTGESRWEPGNTETACIECGATFLHYPSEKEGLFCPDCVRDDEVACIPPTSDPSDGRTTVECAHCQEPHDVFDHTIALQEHFFCDRECYPTWLAEERRQDGVWSASDNPNWQDGNEWSGPYGTGWSHARKRALDRDEYTCQRCGATRGELGQNPDVHHVKPVRLFDEPAQAHVLENLICLCRNCHIEVERSGPTPVISPSEIKKSGERGTLRYDG